MVVLKIITIVFFSICCLWIAYSSVSSWIYGLKYKEPKKKITWRSAYDWSVGLYMVLYTAGILFVFWWMIYKYFNN